MPLPGPVALALCLAVLLAAQAPDDDAAALAAAIRDGDAQAFRRFFDATHADLLRALARRGLGAAAAEDVAQQAYVWIWEHRGRVDPQRPLRGLLFRIGVTRALNHHRDHGRLDALDAEPEGPAEGDAVELAELRAALDAAVAALPDRRRQTFRLCFTDGLTHREAAEVMGVSPRTVEHQMALALGAVREHLAPFTARPGDDPGGRPKKKDRRP